VTKAAGRLIPVLLVLLLVAVMTSITAIDVITALLILATLVTLVDAAVRARYRLPLGLPILALAVVTLLSAALSDHPGVAFFESKHLLSLPLFFIAVNGFESPAAIRRALPWYFGAVALASVYAILQTLACSTTVALPWWAGAALKVKLETCRAIYPFRAKGFFSIYMTLGGSLLIALATLLALLALARTRRAPWLIATGLLAFVALGLTYVRNAWAGLGVAIVVLTALTRRVWLIVPVALAVLVAVAVPSALKTRLLSMTDPADETARERVYFWDAGRRMVQDAPLLGLGPGGVRRHYPEYKHPDAKRPRTGHLHNNLVQIAAERGLLGLAAWCWIWIAFFVRARGIYRALPPARGDDRALVAGSLAAVAGFLVAGLFEYNFGDSEVINLLLVVMAFPFVCAREALAARADTAAE
jgi:O-antigen ligase